MPAATTTPSMTDRLSVFAFAAVLIGVVVGGAFAVGWVIGRVLL